MSQTEVLSSPVRGYHGTVANMRREALLRGRSYAKVAHHARIAVGGTTDGVYSFQISTPADQLPTDPVLVSFTASSSTADQICTGLAAAAAAAVIATNGANVPALTNVLTATADLANDYVELTAVRTGEAFTVTLVSNPSTNMVLSTVTSATQAGLALGIGMVDSDGLAARVPASGDTGAGIMGVMVLENNMYRSEADPLADAVANAGVNLSIVTKGDVYIDPEVEVAITDPVYCRLTATGTEVVGAWRNDADGVAQVTTGTPDAVNAGVYQLMIVYGPGPGVDVPEVYSTGPFTADGTATAAEVVTGMTALFVANAALTARIVVTGTTTLIMTGQNAGVPFTVTSTGPTGTWASITTGTAPSADAVHVSKAKWLQAGGPTSGTVAVLSFD